MTNGIKYLILLGIAFNLTACLSGNPDTHNGYKLIQGYVKNRVYYQETDTDPVQRKKDVMDCGVIAYNAGDLDLNTKYPGMTDEQVEIRRKRIQTCMLRKDYWITDYLPACTDWGKPVTWNCDPEPCSTNSKWCAVE